MNSNYFPEIDPRVVALRLVRVDVKNNAFVNYEAVTFPKNPNSGCVRMLRQARICGPLNVNGSNFCIDLLDDNEDIIQELSVDKRPFDFLKRKLKVRRVKAHA